ncbi:hypothetical protein JRI60_01325 [Archangium violaceum]|uniref:hypothetical protein n=1 Tax=Archangium violaceum TaxID=83451 RepID=UPI0019508A92|nr:hypothetical protein [Archangium violaceum]QRN97757.1 hypothetical protein JRI60_01325 [Archangium violaceum]
MLSLAALAFCVSAVSWLSDGTRGPTRWAAACTGLAAAACCVAGSGAVGGLLVLLVLAMTVASVLVLVLAPRPEHARTVALVSGLLGLVPAVLAGVHG